MQKFRIPENPKDEPTLTREVDGVLYRFPAHFLNEFEFWFAGRNGQPGMYAIINGKVDQKEDTGMCGPDALQTTWIPVAVAMHQKCYAEIVEEEEKEEKDTA